jgi:hypothetical protein
MSKHEISNSDDVIDSRDVIARLEELREKTVGAADDFSREEMEELKILAALEEDASDSPDWRHGEALIRESYFTDYIEELINDCYELPKEMNSGEWPYRHMKIDFEAAAHDAKADYFSCDFDGITYLIRS